MFDGFRSFGVDLDDSARYLKLIPGFTVSG